MPSPREGESQSGFVSRCMSSKEAQNSFPDQKQRTAFCHSQWENKGKSAGGIFIYEDPRTGELYHYARKGIYRKSGRTLIFVKQSRGNTMTDIIMQIDESMQDIAADEKAGYPPNCNEGYVEKDGRCVPKEDKKIGETS